MRSIVQFIILILTLLACSEKPKTANSLQVDFTDTIRRTEVKKFSDGDSLVVYQIITFTPNDLTVPIDSFYYEASRRHDDKGENYRIYFDRKKVISYCDSMLKALSHDTLGDFDAIQMYSVYSSILKNAQQGFGDAIFLSETHYLLNRFRPLIVNPETGYKPDYYFMINRRSSEREDIERGFINQKGDTFSLSWENIYLKIDTMK